MKATLTDTLRLHLNVLLEKKDAALYEAHCLELDLVAYGATVDIAMDEVLNLIDVQIRTCVENDNLENLFFPAPKEVWAKLAKAQSESGTCHIGRIERPLPKPFNIYQGMEVDQFCYA